VPYRRHYRQSKLRKRWSSRGAYGSCGSKGAVLNVRTNLASIPDGAFARELLSKCSALEEEAASNLSQILNIAETNIGKP